MSPPDTGILEIPGNGHSALGSQLKSNTEGFPSGSAVKNLPVMQEIRVQSLGQEDPLEKQMATHSSFLAWEIPRTEDPGGLLSIEFSRQENWSGLPFPPPGEIPNPGIKSVSPGFITVPFGNPLYSSIGDKQWKALTAVLTAIHFPIRMLHFVFVL